MRFLTLVLALLPWMAAAQERLPSDCIALARNGPRLERAAFGDPLAEDMVRIRFLQHAMFAIEGGGLLSVTDYTGEVGNPDVVPDIVTMNNAHSTHYTDTPDPRIPLVLRGWGPPGQPAAYDLDLGTMRIRNVTTDLRGPFGEGARKDGNSIFIFEVAGLCIGHLSHLHQIPRPEQYAAIGRLDVVMVPVDGAYTMDQAAMAGVVRHLRARVVLPMHWFSAEGLARFLALLKPDYKIVVAEGPEIEVTRAGLPEPEVVVLQPALIP